MRGRLSSISITEPVGLLAPLLAARPTPRPDDEVPASDRITFAPSSTAPVTVAHTQSVPIPLVGPTPGSAGLSSRGAALGLGAAGALVLGVVLLISTAPFLRRRAASVSPPPTESAMLSFAAPVSVPRSAQPAAAATPTPTPTPISEPASRPDSDLNAKNKKGGAQTLLLLPRSSLGHRIFVDGRVVGSGPEPVTVKCGRHSIKIGSAGKARTKDLPCGGELDLAN